MMIRRWISKPHPTRSNWRIYEPESSTWKWMVFFVLLSPVYAFLLADIITMWSGYVIPFSFVLYAPVWSSLLIFVFWLVSKL